MTSTQPQAIASQVNPTPALPPLENGDRLIRPEFERRYHAMPDIKKAELIEGVVYMASPLRFRSHAEPHGDLIGWLWTYKIATPQVQMGIEPTVRLDLENELQPDGVLLIRPENGGQSTLDEQGYIQGAPELVAEIAASSAAIDLGDKKRAYRRNGVKEYIIWQVFDEKIDWFRLEDGDYVSVKPDEQGIIRSQVFPGLWLDIPNLIQGNMQQVLTVLQQGISSPEHQGFVQASTPAGDKSPAS
ncbi:Uma2 family endonuclease [Laspinema sp. D1]|uniref:Uma2 family endonuclease n=1 Tax=Laspinema palackyanum TaxID=3231601 RepID=UPI00346BEE1B|nr:Uma2 family endonuclease [Laspinema sp. D2b]